MSILKRSYPCNYFKGSCVVFQSPWEKVLFLPHVKQNDIKLKELKCQRLQNVHSVQYSEVILII